MIHKHFTAILYVSGVLTMLPLAQFLAPGEVLRMMALQVTEDSGLLLAQHWGLMAFCFGALLVYAARNPQVRRPIVVAAMVEKAGLCALVAVGWNNPSLNGLHGTLIVDGLCVVLYAWCLHVDAGSAAPA